MKRKVLWAVLALALVFPLNLFSQTSQKNDETVFHRCVFGVNFVPYYSGNLYQINWDFHYQSFYLRSLPVNFIELQGNAGFFILRRLSLNFTVGYDGIDQKESFDWHKTYPPYQSHYQNENYGYENTEYVKRFVLRVDARYFLRSRSAHRVAPFVQIGLGKYFASANVERKEWPNNDQDDVKRESNAKDFLSDFNSPLLYDLGFGAEYYFNPSLALNASIVLIAAHRKGTLKAREASDDYTAWFERKLERWDWQTQIGVGLSFYF